MKCKACDVKDICGKVLSICSYCTHFKEHMDDKCVCWECCPETCKYESKFDAIKK